MPQALPLFESPLPPDELAGLALEEHITSRLLIAETDGTFLLEHGPFEETRIAELEHALFSLLIPDVDSHLPALAEWLGPFDFLPRWRMDDLMVSYAPDGGSVGAHVDAYDVFLLQASGTREWLIDTSANPDTTVLEDSEVRQLAQFTPTDSRVLQPGDILYLPPGMPHHGIARGDNCTTWSIGFRAPSARQLVQTVAELLAEQLSDVPLADPSMTRAERGEISSASLATLRAVWRQAVDLDDTQLNTLLGCLLTAHGDTDDATVPNADVSRLHTAPWTRLAWTGDGECVTLWANGESMKCSRELALALSTRDGIEPAHWTGRDRELLDALLAEGALTRVR